MQETKKSTMLEWLILCELYLRHPDVKEVTRHFSLPPNLVVLNQLINDIRDAEKDRDVPAASTAHKKVTTYTLIRWAVPELIGHMNSVRGGLDLLRSRLRELNEDVAKAEGEDHE